ncbi:MAG: NADPH-dependent FMN reductase [Bacillota bacterium]
MKVTALVGSLRKGSYNRLVLRAVLELKPAAMEIEEADIGGLPLYNEDLHAQGFPPAVEAFRDKVRTSDAVLFVTPEYNYSVPGVLKNAIDWASRPPNRALDSKPAAVMGASGSRLGTARAQYHLRQIGVFLNLHFINKPEVMISFAEKVFDASGRLTDETARKLIAELLANLRDWTLKLKSK